MSRGPEIPYLSPKMIQVQIAPALPQDWLEVPPIRLGAVPASLRTPDCFILAMPDSSTKLRIDLYRPGSSYSLHTQAIGWCDWLVIGDANSALLVSLKTGSTRTIPLPSYFLGFHPQDGHLLVLFGEGLMKVLPDGRLAWTNSDLAIDGVTITSIRDGVIYGSGEWDPPSDGIPFAITLAEGKPVAAAI